MRKQILIITAVIAVAVAMVGGTITYLKMSKTVTLSLDGKATEVHTFGDDVGDVLASEGIDLGERDVVAPSPDSAISDGTRIAVRYARELNLSVDGEKSSYWVTETSVGTALSQIGQRYLGADLSASRSSYIGRDGMQLEVSTPKRVVVRTADGKMRRTSTGQTVGDVLKELKLKPDKNDELKPGSGHRLTDGLHIVLTTIDTRRRTTSEAVDHRTVVRYSDDMYKGQEKTTQSGKDGRRRIVLHQVLANGKVRSTDVVDRSVVVKPVATVIVRGTASRPAPKPEPAPASSSGSSSSAPSTNYASGSTVWDQLAQCESGGNWAINTGNGYYGGLQFSLSTWQAYGGSGYPHEASRETQIAIATNVRDANGGSYGSWPACAASLGLPL